MGLSTGRADNPTPQIRTGYRVGQWLIRSTFKLLFGLKVEEGYHVPASGPFILAANHQSWFDPPLIGCSCPRELVFAAKRELFSNLILGPIVRYFKALPVRRTGYDRRLLVSLGEALENGYGTVIFPEGTRYLDGRLRTPKAGIGMIAVRYKAPIVPVFVSGSAWLRKQLWKRGLRVAFGPPFTLKEIDMDQTGGRKGYRAIAEAVMERIARVGGVSPPITRV